jgi:hypothetical protein
MFEPDALAVKNIIDLIKRGDSLLLFPEGRCTIDGTYAGIYKATGKKNKKLGVPVVNGGIQGSYIVWPYWRKRFKRGYIRLTITNLFTAEETKTLEIDEINSRIDDIFRRCDTNPASREFYTFNKKDIAKDLEGILFLCPCCGSEFTLETKEDVIWCTMCENAAIMDRYAALSSAQEYKMPESVQKWYRLQVAHVNKLLSEDMEPIEIPVKVEVSLPKSDGVKNEPEHQEYDYGILSLDKKGWYYEGDIFGKAVKEFFPIDTVPALPFDVMDNFQIYAKGRFHKFTPIDNPIACAKFSILGECAYYRFASKIQMTKSII